MKKRNPSVDVVLPEDVRQILDELAEKRSSELQVNVYASDIVREALEQYLKQLGIDKEIRVNRGGDRRSKRDETND